MKKPGRDIEEMKNICVTRLENILYEEGGVIPFHGEMIGPLDDDWKITMETVTIGILIWM